MAEQYGAIKTYAKAGKTATEAYNLLKVAYGDKALSRTRVFDWFKQFKDGREDAESRAGKGTPRRVRIDKNVEMVKNLINDDRRKSIEDVVSESGLSRGTIERIIHDDLHLSKKAARWVPRLLNSEHKHKQIAMAEDLQRRYFQQGEAFFRSIVTMDESWVSFFTPEMKAQSKQWLEKGAPPPKKAKVQNSTKKIMLVAFFDIKGMIYQHWVPKAQTINSAYYIEVISKFLDHLRKKRPEKLEAGWILHQDNARPHTSRETMEFFAKKKINVLPHAPYSPDLAPCDFWLFPQLKAKLAGHTYDTEMELKVAVEGVLRQLCYGGLQHVFDSWMKRMHKCKAVKGEYVEK